jgi:hypothetical protein
MAEEAAMEGHALSGPANGIRTAHLTDGILVATQFRDIWNGGRHRPEHALAAAVLDTAVADLERNRYAHCRSRQRIYWQVYQWVASDCREWPFSFVNICETLRLSPQALRAQILDPRQRGAARAQTAYQRLAS